MLDQLLVCLGCHWVLQLRLRAKFRFRTDRQRQLRPAPRWLIPVTAEGRFEFRALDWLSMAGLARSNATQRKACRSCEGMLRQRRRENECRLCPQSGHCDAQDFDTHLPVSPEGLLRSHILRMLQDGRCPLILKRAAQQFEVFCDLAIGLFQLFDAAHAVHDRRVIPPAETAANLGQ